MDASAATDAASQASVAGNGNGNSNGNGNGNGNGHGLASDPLRRLEAELEATDGQPDSRNREQPDGARLYEEAQRLLEEAWSIFTECQVMRDSLLAACHEIERTMDSIQMRIGGLPAAGESNGNGHVGSGQVTLAPGSSGAGLSSNGGGPMSNGAGPSSNGAGPH